MVSDLNALPDRPIDQRVEITGPTNAPMQVHIVPNFADHPLVSGPRYLLEDLRCSYATHLGQHTSGVLLLGINDGTKLTFQVHTSRPTRAYKVHGQLGKATHNYFYKGRPVERATYSHVTRDKIDKVVAHMQAAHQKKMLELSGVHMESQTAYDLAASGLIRPVGSEIPVIYGLRCVHFASPNFTLEIQAINENEMYLWTLISDLGIQLKTAAHCTGVQCIRQGKFNLEMALLRKHWQLQNIIDNIERCEKLLNENRRLLQPISAALM
ncbi:Mitochondrial mRNA pseudouridine synthase TRUB2 [Eumeta japonica]|uniref:Mitochondrial mRNA pseudouridine synthase TRUB2 n=1 Tax=Eumeta variegata TaxID=151549 RepID=A0A4C1ZBK3_EUMVA|nr:Mitochondrial mRNA pseudouridine synthase TRUB2 [Eumeta japonica]